MKKYILAISLLIPLTFVSAQMPHTAAMDTASFSWKGKVTIEGYIDTYYAYNFNSPSGNDQPYFVSMARHNEMNINLAYVDLRYTASRLRARFVPGFGTYVNSNNAAEPGSLRNIIEASAGIKLSDKKNIWIDAGVFGSPYTNESAISKDHLAYTRSFAPEYVPYYLSGLKLTIPVSGGINAYVYLLNGWQQIQDQNKSKSLGTQLEIRASNHLLLNWNTYLGNERSAADSTIDTRMFSDFYFIYTKERLSATGCIYAGVQKQAEGKDGVWWQANLIGRYNISNEFSITGRIEHFNDPDEVQIVPITGVSGFRSYSSSLGLNYKLAENILLRLEGRTFFSDKHVYMHGDEPSKNSNAITSNITIWF
jgi:hypothetical protein